VLQPGDPDSAIIGFSSPQTAAKATRAVPGATRRRCIAKTRFHVAFHKRINANSGPANLETRHFEKSSAALAFR
jgi:hypothetical protein